MKDKVIIITFDMIPNAITWGGCQRMYYLARDIHSRGFDITVFSCDKAYKNMFGHDLEFKVIPLKSKNKFSNMVLNRRNSGITKSNKNKSLTKNNIKAKFKRIIKKSLNVLKPIDDFIYNEPQVLKGWISTKWANEHYDYFCQYIQNENVKTVIISAPPFGLFHLVARLKKKFENNLKIIIDYRDPWNLWKRGSFISISKERSALYAADKIIVTNEFYGRDLSKYYNVPQSKVEIVENGYSNEDWDKVSDVYNLSFNFFKISFVGSIGLTDEKSYRNCNNLFIAFDKFRNEYSNVILEFVGVSNSDSNYVRQLKLKFGSNIIIKGFVPSLKAIEYMKNTHVLLLIHTANDNSSKYLVSGKLYDYIRAGRPILSIGSQHGIHHKLIIDNNIGISVEDDATHIYNKLVDLYKKWETGSLDSYEKIIDSNIFSREYQNSKYYDIIHDIK